MWQALESSGVWMTFFTVERTINSPENFALGHTGPTNTSLDRRRLPAVGEQPRLPVTFQHLLTRKNHEP